MNCKFSIRLIWGNWFDNESSEVETNFYTLGQKLNNLAIKLQRGFEDGVKYEDDEVRNYSDDFTFEVYLDGQIFVSSVKHDVKLCEFGAAIYFCSNQCQMVIEDMQFKWTRKEFDLVEKNGGFKTKNYEVESWEDED